MAIMVKQRALSTIHRAVRGVLFDIYDDEYISVSVMPLMDPVVQIILGGLDTKQQHIHTTYEGE